MHGISYLLREVIVQSGASSQSGQVPRAHGIRGIVASSAFFRNCLFGAFWRRPLGGRTRLLHFFSLRDLSFNSDGFLTFCPFVSAGERIG